jgi:hypothetical protein
MQEETNDLNPSPGESGAPAPQKEPQHPRMKPAIRARVPSFRASVQSHQQPRRVLLVGSPISLKVASSILQ